MHNSSPSLNAILVVDNSLLVMLCEYYCARWAAKLGSAKLLPEMTTWIAALLGVLKCFAPDSSLHCTDCVASEFRPHAGRLSSVRGIQRSNCDALASHVRSHLSCAAADVQAVAALRTLATAPKKLVGPDGLSNNDLSLVALALRLTGNGEAVYILSNDQDFLTFCSWVRTNREARSMGNPSLVQGFMGLTYLELIHRDCRIQTDQMRDLVHYAIGAHYARAEMVGTEKGTFIMRQLLGIDNAMQQSMQIKQARGATT
jgi:hypothetical protein